MRSKRIKRMNGILLQSCIFVGWKLPDRPGTSQNQPCHHQEVFTHFLWYFLLIKWDYINLRMKSGRSAGISADIEGSDVATRAWILDQPETSQLSESSSRNKEIASCMLHYGKWFSPEIEAIAWIMHQAYPFRREVRISIVRDIERSSHGIRVFL